MAEFDGEVVINTRMNTDEAEEGCGSLSNAMQSLSDKVEQIGEMLNATLQEINEGMSNSGASARGATDEISDGAEKANTSLMDLLGGWEGITNSAAEFGSVASSALMKAFSIGEQVKGSIDGMKASISGTADNMVNMIKRTAMMMLGVRGMFMLVRKAMSAFNTGAKSLAQYSDSFNTAMSNMTNSINQLKYSIAAVVQPIIELVEPIVTALFDKISAGLQRITAFLSALTGKSTYTKAIKQATSYAKAQTAAAKATENSLNALEELNVIGNNSDSSSTSSDSSPLYEVAQVGEDMKSLADYWKKLFTSGDFRTIGKELGNTIAKALNKIPWETVRQKATKAGQGFAGLLNGFIQSDGLSAYGNALGNWENQIGYLMGGFVDDFEWKQNGVSIGQALNAYMNPTDWNQFYHNAKALWGGLADMLNEIINTDGLWENIGTTIAGKLMVAINSWWAFVTTFDFAGFGEGVGKMINQALTDMAAVDETGKNGWQKLGESIFASVDGIIVALSDAISTTDWVAVRQAIVDLVSSIDWGQAMFDMTKCAFAIGGAICTLLTGEDMQIDFEDALEDIASSIQDGSWATAFKEWGRDIWENVSAMFVDLAELLFGDKLKSIARSITDGEWVSAFALWGQDIWDAVVGVLEGLGGWIDEHIIKPVMGWIDDAKKKIDDFLNYFETAFTGDDKSGAKSALGWILDGMPDEATTSSGHGSGGSFGTPGAATGAVIPRTASEHLIRVGDNNAETEIISPLSTMKQALLEAMAESGGGTQNISLSIDGQQMFEWLVKKNKDNFMRTHQNQLMY